MAALKVDRMNGRPGSVSDGDGAEVDRHHEMMIGWIPDISSGSGDEGVSGEEDLISYIGAQ